MITTLLGILIFLAIIMNFLYHLDYRYGKRKLERLTAGDTIQDGSRLLRVVVVPVQELKESYPGLSTAYYGALTEDQVKEVLGRFNCSYIRYNVESSGMGSATRLKAEIY